LLTLIVVTVLTVLSYLFARTAPAGAVAGLEAFSRGIGLFNRFGAVVDGILILTRGGRPSSPGGGQNSRPTGRIAGLAVETTTVIEEEPIPILKGAVVGKRETYPADYDPTDI